MPLPQVHAHSTHHDCSCVSTCVSTCRRASRRSARPPSCSSPSSWRPRPSPSQRAPPAGRRHPRHPPRRPPWMMTVAARRLRAQLTTTGRSSPARARTSSSAPRAATSSSPLRCVAAPRAARQAPPARVRARGVAVHAGVCDGVCGGQGDGRACARATRPERSLAARVCVMCRDVSSNSSATASRVRSAALAKMRSSITALWMIKPAAGQAVGGGSMMEGAAGPSRPQDEQAPAQSDERMAVLQTTTAGVAERARRVCSGSGLRDCITCGPHNCTHDRTYVWSAQLHA